MNLESSIVSCNIRLTRPGGDSLCLRTIRVEQIGHCLDEELLSKKGGNSYYGFIESTRKLKKGNSTALCD